MEENQTKTSTGGPRRRWLMRGEAVIASLGITLAVILLAAMATSAWWTFDAQRQSNLTARTRQVDTVSDLLAQTSAALLEDGDLSTVRRMVVESAIKHQFDACRIVLPDGSVIADANPAAITQKTLPTEWPGAKTRTSRPATAATNADGVMELQTPLWIEGRGAARLEIKAAMSSPILASWETQAGVGAIGAMTMLALLIVYRRMRSKLRAITSIRESLLAMDAGEPVSSTMIVSQDLGTEATAWNTLVQEQEQLRKQKIAERAHESFGSSQGSSGGLSSACDAMSQGLVLVDKQLTVRYANGAAAVFLRTRRDDLISGNLQQFITNADVLASSRGAAQGTTRHRSVFEIERGEPGTDDTGMLRISVRPVRESDAANAMIVIEDITQQRVAEESRHAFVAQATHELRTPLTNIRLYVETALDEGDDDPAIRADCLNVINKEATRLERIVGDMLSVAEIEAGALKLRHDDVHLKDIFSQLEGEYRPQAVDKQVSLAFNMPPKLEKMLGDQDKIILALHNMVSNAIKYTPAGGQVNVNVDENNGELNVEVADTGIGISPEDCEHVFDKFYRAKDRRIKSITGSGLGLALAREVARLHGGDIVVESEMNKGTRFVMTLPTGVRQAA